MPRPCEFIPTPEQIEKAALEIRGRPGRDPVRGSPAVFALSVLEATVRSVTEFCERYRMRRTAWSADRYRANVERNLMAVEWILSDERAEPDSYRLTFLDICDHCGLDPEDTRKAIMRRFRIDGLRELASVA